MFSGGMDSTALFWKLINENKSIHVHHLYLVNKENRATAEDKSVKEINEYMKRFGYFSYSESFHEYPCYEGNFLWDSDMFSFMAGAICLSSKTIEEVAIGMTKSDATPGIPARIERSNKIFEAFGTRAKKIYPLIELTKKQVHDMLPEELRNMTWSCRTPSYEGENSKECGKCKTCREIKKISLNKE